VFYSIKTDVLHKLSFISFAISCPCLDSKKNYKNVVGPLKFGGHIVSSSMVQQHIQQVGAPTVSSAVILESFLLFVKLC
jgi:hypothetical protein